MHLVVVFQWFSKGIPDEAIKPVIASTLLFLQPG
jgi:hypothetical protein